MHVLPVGKHMCRGIGGVSKKNVTMMWKNSVEKPGTGEHPTSYASARKCKYSILNDLCCLISTKQICLP